MALFIEEKSSCHGCNTKNKPKSGNQYREILPTSQAFTEKQRGENHHPERHGIAQDCHLPWLRR